MSRPTDKEIDEQVGLAVDNNGRYPGMTYEEGVKNALLWAQGEFDEPPLDPDEL